MSADVSVWCNVCVDQCEGKPFPVVEYRLMSGTTLVAYSSAAFQGVSDVVLCALEFAKANENYEGAYKRIVEGLPGVVARAQWLCAAVEQTPPLPAIRPNDSRCSDGP